jgi:hypothetical protein|nr:MAG TPA: hypothetical protein [Bacteriophage sp.]
MVKNVCLMLAVLLMVHLSCDAATAGECESCMSGEPTTLQVIIRDVSMGSLSAAAADAGLYELADVLLSMEDTNK